MAKKKPSLAGFTTDQLDKLACDIVRYIEIWESDFTAMKNRIEENERLYSNSPSSVIPSKDSPLAVHIPIIKPRVSQRRSSVSQTLFSTEPYFVIAGSNNSHAAKVIEDTLQFFLSNVYFKGAFGAALKMAYKSQMSVVRVGYFHSEHGLDKSSTVGPFSGPVFDIIHPYDFSVYPYNTSFESSRWHGHRFDMMAQDIKFKMDAGEWIKHDIAISYSEMSDAAKSNTSLVSTVSVHEIDDSPQECWDGIVRIPQAKNPSMLGRYRVILHRQSRKILHIKPYDAPITWYVPITIEPDPNKVIPDDSPVQDLQGLQKVINRMVAIFITGSEMTARPPILSSTSQLGKRMKGYSPGEVIPMDRAPDARPLITGFKSENLHQLISLMRQMADSSGRVADTLTGAPSSNESTATEQQIKYQAFQVAGNDDIEGVTPALLHIAKLCLYYAKVYFESWSPIYSSLNVEDAHIFEANVTVQLRAHATNHAPATQMQFAQQMLEIMQGVPELQAIKPQLIITLLENSPLHDKQALIDQLKQLANANQTTSPMQMTEMGMTPEQAMMLTLQSAIPNAALGGHTIPISESENGYDQTQDFDPNAFLMGAMAAEQLGQDRIENTRTN